MQHAGDQLQQASADEGGHEQQRHRAVAGALSQLTEKYQVLHAYGTEVDDDAVADIWYPSWEAKYHLDYALRTPTECAEIAGADPAAASLTWLVPRAAYRAQ